MSNLYKIPLQTATVLAGQHFPACDLRDSITQLLELIIRTRFGEHRFDRSFGCEIWDLDFELIVSEKKWEEKLRQSLLQSITTHEQRLTDIDLKVEITEVKKLQLLQQAAEARTEVRKRVEITITGTIVKTGEPFPFRSSLFLSPLAAD